jgi:hypothetical protein
MFNASSILSSLLKRTVGVPEVNLNKLPFANKIVGDWEEKSMSDLVKQLPKETINRLIKVCNEELAKR